MKTRCRSLRRCRYMTNLELLIEMYKTYSPSEHEADMRRIVERELKQNGIKYETDTYGQVYSVGNKDMPLLVAHMDQVSNCKPAKHIKIKRGVIKAKKYGNLGADDKNGVWLILQIVKQYSDVNFIFSVAEEKCDFQFGTLLELCATELDAIPYALVLDRRNGSNIIGVDNGYCKNDLENVVSQIGLEHGYKPEIGIFGDADTLARFIPCVNLSCGYYNPHTEQEYTVIKHLDNALNFACALIKDVPKLRYEIADHGLDKWERLFDDWAGEVEDKDTDDKDTRYAGICARCSDYKFVQVLWLTKTKCVYVCPACFTKHLDEYPQLKVFNIEHDLQDLPFDRCEICKDYGYIDSVGLLDDTWRVCPDCRDWILNTYDMSS